MDMFDIAMLGLVVIGLALLAAGACQQVVIYYDVEEFFVSLLGVVLPVSAYLMLGVSPFESALLNNLWCWALVPLVGGIGMLCLLCNFTQAWQHSHDYGLTLLIGAFRLVYVSLLLVVLMGSSEQFEERKHQQAKQSSAWLWLVLVGLLTRSLINGQSVIARKSKSMHKFK